MNRSALNSTDTFVAWGALWRSDNALDGKSQHIIRWPNRFPSLFRTKREAKEFISEHYGYIGKRMDLRREPHGWKVPIPVRVKVSLSPLSNGS